MNFLVEHNAIDLLTGVIAKSKAPRATVSYMFYNNNLIIKIIYLFLYKIYSALTYTWLRIRKA